MLLACEAVHVEVAEFIAVRLIDTHFCVRVESRDTVQHIFRTDMIDETSRPIFFHNDSPMNK
jgi:hypothetical protein